MMHSHHILALLQVGLCEFPRISGNAEYQSSGAYRNQVVPALYECRHGVWSLISYKDQHGVMYTVKAAMVGDGKFDE